MYMYMYLFVCWYVCIPWRGPLVADLWLVGRSIERCSGGLLASWMDHSLLETCHCLETYLCSSWIDHRCIKTTEETAQNTPPLWVRNSPSYSIMTDMCVISVTLNSARVCQCGLQTTHSTSKWCRALKISCMFFDIDLISWSEIHFCPERGLCRLKDGGLSGEWGGAGWCVHNSNRCAVNLTVWCLSARLIDLGAGRNIVLPFRPIDIWMHGTENESLWLLGEMGVWRWDLGHCVQHSLSIVQASCFVNSNKRSCNFSKHTQ